MLISNLSHIFSKFALKNKYNNDETEELCEIFVNIATESIILWLIANVIDLSLIKFLTQLIIHCEIFLFFRLCISLECEIVLNASATFKLNKMIIRFVFCSYTMCICFVNSSSAVSVNLSNLTLMQDFNNNRCVFTNQKIFLFIIDFMIFSIMLSKIMRRHVFEMM